MGRDSLPLGHVVNVGRHLDQANVAGTHLTVVFLATEAEEEVHRESYIEVNGVFDLLQLSIGQL